MQLVLCVLNFTSCILLKGKEIIHQLNLKKGLQIYLKSEKLHGILIVYMYR